MRAPAVPETPAQEPVRASFDELAIAARAPRNVERIGEVRLPVSLHHRPRATLYRLPDGRRVWVVRLWQVDRPVPHLATTGELLAFARRNRYLDLAREVSALDARGRR